MTRGEEDYIKAIFHLIEQDSYKSQSLPYVSNNRLAQQLNHTPQTVNEMVKRLEQKDLLTYTPYKGSKLTQAGKDLAGRLTRIHRLWEAFLVQKLDYTWEEVHEEAEILEHATSPILEERLYEFLGKPEYCPHGNLITSSLGQTNQRNVLSILEGRPGSYYALRKVSDDKELLVYLNNKNIKLGDVLLVKEKDEISNLIKLENNGQDVIIGNNIAKEIFVEELKNNVNSKK